MTRRRPTPTTDAQPRRSGVSIAFAAEHLPLEDSSAATAGEMRATIARDRAEMQIDAIRGQFLSTIERLARDVLPSLADLDSHHHGTVADEDLRGWLQRWNLTAPWCATVARHTLRLWAVWPSGRGRTWDQNMIDTGTLGASGRGRPTRKPGEVLIRQRHFDWCVRSVVLSESANAIAKADPELSGSNSQRTVARAIAGLSRRLDLAVIP